MNKISKLYNKKRAVSPVIAVILLIALTVGTIAIVYAVTQNLFSVTGDELILDSYGVADVDGDNIGDLVRLYLRNIGTEDSFIDEVTLSRDNTALSSWVLVENNYSIVVGGMGFIELKTLSGVDQINSQNEVSITIESSVTNGVSIVDIAVPNSLSALPILYPGGGFSTIDINSQGWTEYTYNTHGGGAGIYVDDGDILFDTNDDILYYLNNDTYKIQNGIIAADFLYGDDDGIGIAFRITDPLNYYWVGITEDHNGPSNRAGESEATFDGPWFIYDGQFELHKIVNGVDTILANGITQSFSVSPGTTNNPTGPYGLKISFTGSDMAFEARYGTDNYEELFSVTDTEFADSGYFGVFSLAADGTRLDNFVVTA